MPRGVVGIFLWISSLTIQRSCPFSPRAHGVCDRAHCCAGKDCPPRFASCTRRRVAVTDEETVQGDGVVTRERQLAVEFSPCVVGLLLFAAVCGGVFLEAVRVRDSCGAGLFKGKPARSGTGVRLDVVWWSWSLTEDLLADWLAVCAVSGTTVDRLLAVS